MKIFKYFVGFCLGTLSSFIFANKDIQITAECQPSTLYMGDRTTLTVTIQNAILRQFDLPRYNVPNLSIRYESGSFNTRYINGVSEQMTVWRFTVQPKSEGDFQIPEVKITLEGKSYTIPACHVKVLPANNTPTNPNSRSNGRSIFLRISSKVPTTWYIGQSVPITIQLLVAPNVRCQLTNVLQKHGDSFSATHLLDSPSKSDQVIQNTPYQCLSWETLVTPLKTGAENLSFSLDMAVEQPRNLRNVFEDEDEDLFSFFNRSLQSAFSQPQPVTIETQTISTQIQGLPQPQPQPFHQGIGHFQLATPTILEKEAIQNEPLTLEVILSGEGNFERIQEPTLEFNENEWRTYLPKSNFESSDAIGYKGRSTYEYTIVPLKSGEIELPIPHFCYFDPITKSYVQLKKQATFKVKVKPPIRTTSQLVPSPTTKKDEQGNFVPEKMPSFDQIVLEDVQWESPLWLWQQKGFWVINGLLSVLSLSLGSFGFFRQRNINNPHYHLKHTHHKHYKTAGKALHKAIKEQDAVAFYRCAHQLIVSKLASLNKRGAKVEEFDDLQAQLEAHKIQLSDTQLQYLQRIEQCYQQCQFGRSNQASCPSSADKLEDLLKAIR